MTSPADKLNVLFIISDQHRPDVTGCYGHSICVLPDMPTLGGVFGMLVTKQRA